MKQLSYITLLLSMAASLTAQTLSWGEITAVTPATTPPTYVINIVQTAGTPLSVAGLQFDLNYDSTKITTATLALGASATAASMALNSTLLPAANVPWITGAPAHPNGNPNGQRAIIIGCCTGSQTTPTSNLMADGVVATVTVQPAAVPTAAGVYTLNLLNLMGTTAGALNTAAGPITFTIGAGSSDPMATGTVDLYGLYMAGGVYPSTSDSSPNFGSGALALNDLLSELFALNNLTVSGYPSPVCGTDRFDAMDTYPQDTPTARGGARTGKLTLNDLLTELFMLNNLTGYTTRPVRVSAPYTCPVPGGGSAPAGTITARMSSQTPPEVSATLSLGANEGAGNGQDRVPVYLEARREFTRLALTFGLGDERSQLQFQAGSAGAPSMAQDSTTGLTGAIAVAWLDGLNIGSGQRLLLGYVVGPAGSAGNLKIFGMSASILGTFQEVGLDVSGATAVRR